MNWQNNIVYFAVVIITISIKSSYNRANFNEVERGYTDSTLFSKPNWLFFWEYIYLLNVSIFFIFFFVKERSPDANNIGF